MTVKPIIYCLLAGLLTGCAGIGMRSAMVGGGVIENPALGFFGFKFNVPDGFEVYNPARRNPLEYTDLQKMAIRIYDLNRAYHPRGNETFYESFLMMSETTCFLLITVKNDGFSSSFDDDWDTDELTSQWQLMPLYNIDVSGDITLGRARLDALRARGHAYEHKGWYYSGEKSNRMPFSYEACKVSGANKENYILIGFSQPEHKHILALQADEMVNGFDF